MRRFLEQKQEEMLGLIEKLVNIDSGSYEKKGVDQVGAILKAAYEELDFKVEVIEQGDYGNHLIVQHDKANEPNIVILAHMDTVFPSGTASERPFVIKGDRAYGPGVIDMKSSLVSVLYAIKALKNIDSSACQNVLILLNSDEEIGSPTSRKLIEERAKGKKYALVMEPARKDGSIVSARRGKGNFTIHVKGKAAHSGIEPEKGRSAIEELAYKVIQLQHLNDYEKGISVNVGLIEGGSSVNTVSEHAIAHVDVRIKNQNQADLVEGKIEEICSSTQVPGTEVEMEGEINRPPMVKNDKTELLLEVIRNVGKELGVEISDTATGGGSDASFTSAVGVATIDGLGPIGGNAHSEGEYLEIPSLVERTFLLATVLQRLSK